MNVFLAVLIVVAWGAIALATWDIWRMKTGRKFRLRSKEEEDFSNRLDKSFKSLKVVGRGTVVVDAAEVQQSEEFKKNLARGKSLVKDKNERQD